MQYALLIIGLLAMFMGAALKNRSEAKDMELSPPLLILCGMACAVMAFLLARG